MGDSASAGYRVERGRVEDPQTRLGASFFASMFEERPAPEDLTRSTESFSAGIRIPTHRHTGPVAACLTRGTFTFVFGADGEDVVDLAPGDYIWIGAGVMHDEQAGAQDVEMITASLRPVETIDG